MRFGLDVSQHQLTWDEILRRTRFAEDAGFDGAWVFDHFTALYADPDGPCLEGWTLLAGLAAATSKIRLGTLVTGMTHRLPSILATEVVTVDHISGGRVECAVGAAWNTDEHTELGIPFPSLGGRMDRLEEGVQVLTLLMSGERVSFDGEHYHLDGALFREAGPAAARRSGSAEDRTRTLPTIGRYADAWRGWVETPGARRAERHRRPLGREAVETASICALPACRQRAVGRGEAHVQWMRDSGIGYLTVSWPSERAAPGVRQPGVAEPRLTPSQPSRATGSPIRVRSPRRPVAVEAAAVRILATARLPSARRRQLVRGNRPLSAPPRVRPRPSPPRAVGSTIVSA
jgi:hypothetical protein